MADHPACDGQCVWLFVLRAPCGICSWDRQSFSWQAGAAAAVASGRDVLGSVLFCLAMNHKQMAVFYAPAFFAHLLGKCLQKPSPSSKVCCVLLSDSAFYKSPAALTNKTVNGVISASVLSCSCAVGCYCAAWTCCHSDVCCGLGTLSDEPIWRAARAASYHATKARPV